MENADDEQSNLVAKSKNLDEGKKNQIKQTNEKGFFFWNNWGLILGAREKVLNNLKGRFFPIKNLDKVPTPEPSPEPTQEIGKEITKGKKFELKFQQ